MRKTKIVDITNIFNVGGIYIWKCGIKFVYIGTSQNLLQRATFPKHLLELFPEFPNSTLKLYIIEDTVKRKALEAKLIRRYKPILNLQNNPAPIRTKKKLSKPTHFNYIDRQQAFYTRKDSNSYQQYGKVL